MIINSNFRDYYDSSHGGWIDKTIVYNRKEEDIYDIILYKKYKKEIGYIGSDIQSTKIDGIKITKKFFIVGFCGKLYILFHYKKFNKNTNIIIEESFNYNKNNIELYIKNNDYSYRNKYYLNEIENVYNIFNNRNDNTLFLKYKTPIFIIKLHDDFSLRKDIKLNDIEFFKVKDSFSAYNDLEIFLSNILLTNEKENIEISDKDKIISKGFDYKFSFRKDKK